MLDGIFTMISVNNFEFSTFLHYCRFHGLGCTYVDYEVETSRQLLFSVNHLKLNNFLKQTGKLTLEAIALFCYSTLLLYDQLVC